MSGPLCRGWRRCPRGLAIHSATPLTLRAWTGEGRREAEGRERATKPAARRPPGRVADWRIDARAASAIASRFGLRLRGGDVQIRRVGESSGTTSVLFP